jgi:hypothetical protein
MSTSGVDNLPVPPMPLRPPIFTGCHLWCCWCVLGNGPVADTCNAVLWRGGVLVLCSTFFVPLKQIVRGMSRSLRPINWPCATDLKTPVPWHPAGIPRRADWLAISRGNDLGGRPCPETPEQITHVFVPRIHQPKKGYVPAPPLVAADPLPRAGVQRSCSPEGVSK